jgi:hypothetical protein
MVVDVVQERDRECHVTLATPEDEALPAEWRDLQQLHVTTVDRFSVHDFAVSPVRVGTSRIVVRAPDDDTPVERRVYARIFRPVPAAGMVLDDLDNRWVPFTPDVRDLGGGGCSLLAEVPLDDGAIVTLSFALDDGPPIVTVARVLPHEALPRIGRVLSRVEFQLIREADRDRILRFVLLSLAGRRHRPDLTVR